MHFYFFSSKKFNKISKKINYFRDSAFSSFEAPKNLKTWGFFTSLFYEYVKFLFFKYFTDSSYTEGTYCRSIYCVNRIFKHFLIIE